MPEISFLYSPDAIYPDHAWYLNDDESDPCPESHSYFENVTCQENNTTDFRDRDHFHHHSDTMHDQGK